MKLYISGHRSDWKTAHVICTEGDRQWEADFPSPRPFDDEVWLWSLSDALPIVRRWLLKLNPPDWVENALNEGDVQQMDEPPL